jgi:pimeloyl-ACP methyl ester carboxylesterase
MRDFGTIDFPTWFREAGVPIRAINAALPNETRVEINRKYADFDVILMEGVGHYLHMTRPEEFNRHLLAVLADLAS